MSEEIDQESQKLEKQEETPEVTAKVNDVENKDFIEENVSTEGDQGGETITEKEQTEKQKTPDDETYVDGADMESVDDEKVNTPIETPLVIQDYLDHLH